MILLPDAEPKRAGQIVSQGQMGRFAKGGVSTNGNWETFDLGMSLGDGEDKSANLQRLHQLQSTFCWVRQRIQQVG